MIGWTRNKAAAFFRPSRWRYQGLPGPTLKVPSPFIRPILWRPAEPIPVYYKDKERPPRLFKINPLQAGNHAREPETYKFICFYYIPKGATYDLFSAGVDGIPHTQDDIYLQRPLK